MSNGLAKTDYCCVISDVLATHQAVESATLFGSRAKGTNKPYSDIDIALFGDIDYLEVEQIISDLDEQPTIYKYDVVAYAHIKNPRLKSHIDRVGIPIYAKALEAASDV